MEKGMSHKYGAKRTEVDGISFDSKAESRYYQQLKLLLRSGEIIDIILQPKFNLLPSYTKNGHKIRGIDYVADFLVTYKDGRKEIIDVKGAKTDVYKVKKKWFEHKYPDLTIKEVSV